MNPGLQPGLHYQHTFLVPEVQDVPALYPEAEAFAATPDVFARGQLVALLEWCCLLTLKAAQPPLLPQSLGTHLDLRYQAAILPGMEVTARVELVQVEDQRLRFALEAHDGIERIAHGHCERFLVTASN